jgi:hypothetical protein
MHTYAFKIEGETWLVHADGGMVGDAIITAPPGIWADKKRRTQRVETATTPDGQSRIEFRVPAELLRRFGRDAALTDVISAVEDLM